MKSGSRPIECIARTGELTPPGRSVRARAYSSAERASASSDARVLTFPGLELVREIQQSDLLELGRGVERRALGDAVRLGDRVEDRVALLLAATVGHREDAVGPVLVRRPLVAVGDAAHRRHLTADLEDLLVRHLPDAHAVGGEAGAAVVEDRGDAAQQAALLHAGEVLEELGLG